MNKVKLLMISLAVAIGLATTVAPVYVSASTTSEIRKGVNKVGGSSETRNFGSVMKTVVNTLLYILGAIAVIMIVFGGIRYTTSAGDASRVKASKDTIMYSVIGLVVAIFAFAIVNFVLDNL